MHGSKSKIPSKKSRQAALSGGFNSSVKGLKALLSYNHQGNNNGGQKRSLKRWPSWIPN
jgi:hypothetical protein